MPSYTLKYFKGRGRAEGARMMFALAGQDFEDVRFTREQFDEKEKAAAPFGQLPVLEIDGIAFTQGNGIARFLAKKFGFYGKDDLEFLQIEQVLGLVDDLSNCMIRQYYEKDETRKAEIEKENKEEKVPFFLGCLEKIAKASDSSGHIVGSSITLADVIVHNVCEYFPVINAKDYPAISKIKDTVAANPKIKEWIGKREAREK